MNARQRRRHQHQGRKMGMLGRIPAYRFRVNKPQWRAALEKAEKDMERFRDLVMMRDEKGGKECESPN